MVINMKKISIFFVIVIAILSGVWYLYSVNKISVNEKIANNSYYEKYLNKEVSGTEIATIINKIENNNNKNHVEKDNNGLFVDNKENSIIMTFTFKDTDSVIHFEKIFENGTDKFIELYSASKFKCDKIEYHDSSKKVKSIHFAEI